MLKLLGAFTGKARANRDTEPTHASMLFEHERRKGEELHRRLVHENWFVRK